MENNQTTIPPMPRPKFEAMTDKALQAYLAKNRPYVSAEDPRGTRAQVMATANLVADRRAEDFIAAREDAEKLNQAVAATNEALQKFPKGPRGLTPDEVKATAEWQTAYRNYDKAFQALRKFNGTYTRMFAEELRYDRQARREARAGLLN